MIMWFLFLFMIFMILLKVIYAKWVILWDIGRFHISDGASFAITEISDITQPIVLIFYNYLLKQKNRSTN